MALGFGLDFRRATGSWLYEPAGAPKLWVAILVALALLVLLNIMQMITGFATYLAVYGGNVTVLTDQNVVQNEFVKATLIGLFPAAVTTALVAWLVARAVGKAKPYGLPLHIPALGIAGWASLIIGFCVIVTALYFGLFYVTGIDPAAYAPTADGLNDPNSSAGMAEKALAELASQPLYFAMALPGLGLAIPIAEELIFRGPLFAALAQTRIGRWGAVVVTSAAWALVHVTAPWMFVAIIFLMGLLLGALLLRFGSVLITIVCHSIWNSYTALAIYGSVTG